MNDADENLIEVVHSSDKIHKFCSVLSEMKWLIAMSLRLKPFLQK